MTPNLAKRFRRLLDKLQLRTPRVPQQREYRSIESLECIAYNQEPPPPSGTPIYIVSVHERTAPMTTANHIRVFQNFVNAIDKAHQLWFANWAFQYGAPSEVRSEDDGVQPGFVYRPVDENSTGIEDVEAMISVERCYVEDQ